MYQSVLVVSILLVSLSSCVAGELLTSERALRRDAVRIPHRSTPSVNHSPTSLHGASIADQRAALTDLFHSTNGVHWRNHSNWISSDNFCVWFGVECIPSSCISNLTSNCRVTGLRLPSNQLQGLIPSTIGALTNLLYVDLSFNKLNGTLSLFESMTSMVEIIIFQNALTGTVPSFSKSLSLQVLDVGKNRLVGTVPEFEDLTSLNALYVDQNMLHGTIPSLNSSKELTIISMSQNRLTGTLPQFALHSKLTLLSFWHNSLTGTVPLFGSTLLNFIYLDQNLLTGSVPAFENCSLLETVYLNENMFDGTIPSFSSLVSLRVLYLNQNRLVGSIPSLSNSLMLTDLWLNDNQLTGNIPSFTQHAQLRRLNLHHNQLTGTIPSFPLFALQTLNLGDNLLTGNIPDSLPPFLRIVNFGNNQLSGEILMHQHQFFSSAFAVNLSFNKFNGIFPQLPQPHNLSVLDIADNQFSCPYPIFQVSPPLVVLKGQCFYDWIALRSFLLIGVGLAVFCVSVVLLLRKYCSCSSHLHSFRFIAMLGSASAAAIDILTSSYAIFNKWTYLITKSENCIMFNYHGVFSNFIPWIFLNSQASTPATTLFSDWITASSTLQVLGPYSTAQDIDAFQSFCARAPECSYDPSIFTCIESHPENSLNGGQGHQRFLSFIVVLVAVRIAFECCCLILIMMSILQNSIVGNRVFLERSVLFPVLIFRRSMRTKVLNLIATDFKPIDYFYQLLVNGFIVSIPMLFVNMYFLLAVAQTGLQVSDWASLIWNLIQVPRLIGQALRSWWSLRQTSLSESEMSVLGDSEPEEAHVSSDQSESSDQPQSIAISDQNFDYFAL
jgi:Leucine-rich repeat (LRR) protein